MNPRIRHSDVRRSLLFLLFLSILPADPFHAHATEQGDEIRIYPPDSPLPVGVATLLSGLKASLGREILEGARAFLRDRPLVQGRLLSLIPQDDRCDRQQSLRAAEALCGLRPPPVAVVGYLCSAGAMEALKVHRRCRLPMINVSGGDPRLTEEGSPWVLRIWISRARQADLVAHWVRRRRWRRILLVHESDELSRWRLEAFQKAFPSGSSKDRLQVSTLEAFKETPEAYFRKKRPPQCLYYIGEGRRISELWKAVPKRLLNVPWVLDMRAASHVVHKGPTPRRLFSARLHLPTGDPETPQFRFFRGRFGEPGVYTLAAYDALLVLADALSRAAKETPSGLEVDPASLMKALKETRLEGLTGPLAFDEKGDRRNVEGSVMRWKSGQWVPHWQGRIP